MYALTFQHLSAGIESADCMGHQDWAACLKGRVNDCRQADALTDVAGRVIITTNDTTNLGAPFEWDQRAQTKREPKNPIGR